MMKILVSDFQQEVLQDCYGTKWRKKLKKAVKRFINNYCDELDAKDFSDAINKAIEDFEQQADEIEKKECWNQDYVEEFFNICNPKKEREYCCMDYDEYDNPCCGEPCESVSSSIWPMYFEIDDIVNEGELDQFLDNIRNIIKKENMLKK